MKSTLHWLAATALCSTAVVVSAQCVPPFNHVYNERIKINYTTHYIQTPIDHFPNSDRYKPHTNETFTQRYWYDDTYYKPGGPVFLVLGGEVNAEYDFHYMQIGVTQILMEAHDGLGVILENRYYGESYPFNTSTTDDLRFLTTEQTIADNAHFVQNAVFPSINASLTAPDTPWILYGGSLPGQQAAITVHVYGGDDGLMWGGIAGSGTTKALLEYPGWYDPIQTYGPQDCIGSINGIVAKIDRVFDSGNASAIHHMKSVFGLEDLVDADFAATIAFPLGGPLFYPTNTWQELNWQPDFGSDDFWLFCTNVTNLYAPKNITAVDDALAEYTDGKPWPNLGNYANYIKEYLIPICDGAPINSSACFGTQNKTYWADTANNNDRSYLWSTCTENGLYQAPNAHGPSLLSKAVTVNYTQQWCEWSFPPGEYVSIPATPDLERINKYGGYNVDAPRLAHIDGSQDPWRGVCYHSPEAGPRFTPTEEDAYYNPQLLIAGAGHHWDTVGICDVAAEPQFIRNAHLWEIRITAKWLEECEYPYTSR